MAMNRDQPFYNYSAYLKERYGRGVYRVGVDAGFSCPHRAAGGCSYCDAAGARAVYLRNDRNPSLEGRDLTERRRFVEKQVREGMEFLTRRYEAEEFILYFQANTNTNAPVEELKTLYDHALSLGSFTEFIVSTRPDCLGKGVVELLASYRQPHRDVWVELGLQSGNDPTLDRIGRGHDVASFKHAFQRLREAGIKVAVHLILGLPGEGPDELDETLGLMAELRPEGIKLHNLHIPRETALFEEYLRGEITAPSMARHRELLIYALERIPPETVVMRLTCDTPGGAAAPRRFGNKSGLYQDLREEMVRRGTRQGALLC